MNARELLDTQSGSHDGGISTGCCVVLQLYTVQSTIAKDI